MPDRKVLALTSLAALLAASCGGPRPSLDADVRRSLTDRGLVVEQAGEDGLLCVVNTREHGAEWFLLRGDMVSNERLGSSLSAMGEVVDLKASADGRYLAALSVGEGHPALEVIDLPSLLRGEGYRVVRQVDPYPMGVWIRRWDDGEVVVEGHMLLTHRGADGHVPWALEVERPQRFALDVATGDIRALTWQARHPVRYYVERLSHSDPTERGIAAEALRTLQARSALPALRKALAAEREETLREDIRNAVDELSS